MATPASVVQQWESLVIVCQLCEPIISIHRILVSSAPNYKCEAQQPAHWELLLASIDQVPNDRREAVHIGKRRPTSLINLAEIVDPGVRRST